MPRTIAPAGSLVVLTASRSRHMLLPAELPLCCRVQSLTSRARLAVCRRQGQGPARKVHKRRAPAAKGKLSAVPGDWAGGFIRRSSLARCLQQCCRGQYLPAVVLPHSA